MLELKETEPLILLVGLLLDLSDRKCSLSSVGHRDPVGVADHNGIDIGSLYGPMQRSRNDPSTERLAKYPSGFGDGIKFGHL